MPAGVKIIIAEPNFALYDVLQYNLKKRAHTVLQASSGSEMVELVLKEPPQLLLISLNLGDMDAFEAYEILCLRQKSAQDYQTKRRIPTIIMSPVVDVEKLQRASKLRISGYLIEPFGLDDVINKIDSVLDSDKILEIVKVHNSIVMELRGSLSYHHEKLLKDAFNALFNTQYHNIVIDFSKATFLAHQLLVVMISGLGKARYLGGNIVICGVNEAIQKLFDKAKLEDSFTIVADRPTALRSL